MRLRPTWSEPLATPRGVASERELSRRRGVSTACAAMTKTFPTARASLPSGRFTRTAAKDDVTTLNQLYLPANRPVIVKLRSKDVIHSFNVPEFRVKQDAIPGLTIPIWFIPNVTTAEMRARSGNPEFQYEIACAQLCGLGHFRMRGFVTVETPDEFQKWMDAKVKEAEASGEDSIFQ